MSNVVDKQKITLRLSQEALQTAQAAVSVGLSPTVTAFIEDSIRARRREVRHARLNELAVEAMADPDFVAEMHSTMDAFEPATRDGWPVYDQPDAHSGRPAMNEAA